MDALPEKDMPSIKAKMHPVNTMKNTKKVPGGAHFIEMKQLL